MQVKHPKPAPAIRLIGRISPEAMTKVVQYLDSLSAGVWYIAKANISKGYFVVRYRPTNRRGKWECVFGLDGQCWSD